MRPTVSLVSVVLLSCGAIGCALVTSASSVASIMGTMIDPSANRIWKSVATSVTAEGIKETYPRTDSEWHELRHAAARLSEGGQLLKREHRASGNSEWLTRSQALVDAAARTARAVDAKSPDQILAAGENIYDTCIGCHGRYSMMTPPP